MVKKAGDLLSPSICLSLPALTVFYACARLPPAACVASAFAILGVFSAMLSIRFLAREAAGRHRVFLVLCALIGATSGFAAAFRFQGDIAPIRTLAPLSRISGIAVTLLSDPAPTGSDLQYAAARVDAVSLADGSEFSADGRCTVFLPASIVKAAYPGGVIGALGRPVLFSSGLRVRLSGSFTQGRPGSSMTFRATGVVRDSDSWKTPVDEVRSTLRLSLMRRLYDWGEAGGFLLALLSGNRDYLDPALASDFRNTGLSHILALSGMHLSLLSLVAVRFGKRIGGKRVSIRLSLIAILFFVWFAGFSPSLSRALLMALMLMALGRLGFAPEVLQVLALTAWIQLMWNPLDAQSVAFMLSYGALAGILTFGEAMVDAIPARLRTTVGESLCASVGAQLMTSPVTAVVFGVLAPIGIVASCAASPLSSIFMVAGMALVAISTVIPPLSALCGNVLTVLYDVTANSVRLFSAIPPLSITTLPATIASCVLPLAAGFFVIVLDLSVRKRRSVDDRFARL